MEKKMKEQEKVQAEQQENYTIALQTKVNILFIITQCKLEFLIWSRQDPLMLVHLKQM